MNWIRESFGAKLLTALFGTVGLLLLVTYVVVQGETARQVDVVVDRTIQNAGTLFQQLTDLQRQQAARLARPFTESVRALALLRATLEEGDYDYLADVVDYERELAGLPDALLVITDSEARPVLSAVGEARSMEGDPADVAPLARRLLDGNELEENAYRLVGGRLFDVTSLYVELAGRPIGTISFGLPMRPEDVDRIAEIGRFEACFHIDGACVVRTEGVGEALEEAMNRAAEVGEAQRLEVAGSSWSIEAQPLSANDPARGHRVVAVPLDEVLAPFDRIQSALLVGGGGALLLSALLGLVLSRSLTRPVKALVAATGRVAKGDYATEVEVSTRDEMRALADAFNDMTRGLLLRERYRSVLNKAVSPDVAAKMVSGHLELGGENRLVTVLFADIRGFTSITEGMEPQQVIALLNECMECLSRAIDAEGGVVDKFIGDEVMAVFGAPVTQDDHAKRAVASALRMRAGMVDLNATRSARGDVPLAVGVGINSGVAVAGNMGSTNRLNYTVVGDIVNLAARLAGQAGPGEILVTESTLALAGSGVVASPLGGRALKGFSSEVEVYAVEALADSPAGMREPARS